MWTSIALHGIDVNAVLFQKDVATCHTSYATIDLLLQTCKGILISRNGELNDLTPYYYFLCGAIKEECCADKSDIIEHLKASI